MRKFHLHFQLNRKELFRKKPLAALGLSKSFNLCTALLEMSEFDNERCPTHTFNRFCCQWDVDHLSARYVNAVVLMDGGELIRKRRRK